MVKSPQEGEDHQLLNEAYINSRTTAHQNKEEIFYHQKIKTKKTTHQGWKPIFTHCDENPYIKALANK